MVTFEQVRQIVGDVLQLGDRTAKLEPDTALLGSIPEFDSMAVVSVITALKTNSVSSSRTTIYPARPSRHSVI